MMSLDEQIRQFVKKNIGEVKPPRDAVLKFIEVLRRTIESHAASSGFESGGLGTTAIDALSNINSTEIRPIDNGSYEAIVWFDGNLARKSLYPDKYNGIDNLAALLNNGYDAGRSVYGVWEGHSDKSISSLYQRDGIDFVSEAIRDFMQDYASEYGVVDIIPANIYD